MQPRNVTNGLGYLIALLACVAFVGAYGCREERPHEAQSAKSEESAQKAAADERVQDILALPYAGWTDQSDDQDDGLVVFDAGRSQPGYTLMSLYMLSEAILVDHQGDIVHRWRDPGDAHHWDHVELLPNGEILLTGATNWDEPVKGVVDSSRFVMRMSWDGEIIWRKFMFAHHELTTTPDGNLLTLLVNRREIPEIDVDTAIRDDEIAVLSADGDVLKKVSVLDSWLAGPDKTQFARVRPNLRGGVKAIELFHCNSVEWMDHKQLFDTHPLYGANHVLACSRHQSQVFIVDMTRGVTIWRWGLGELSGPHDAQLLPSGNVLLFDNGVARERSRAVEMDPRTNKIVWQYATPDDPHFYSKSKGSAQRLDNGNTLIANSDNGEAFEVTPDGEVVWHYVVPLKNEKGRRATVVRAIRHDTALIERLLAGSQDKSQ